MYDVSLLRSNRPFRIFWVAEAVETVATGLAGVALPWFVLVVTGDPLQLGVSFALRSAPDVVLSPLVAGLIDRRSRTRLMALGHAGTAALTAALPALYLAGRLGVGHLYLVMVGLSVTGSLSHNASRAALPTVVDADRLEEANALLFGARSGGRVAFLLAGGALTVALGPATVLAGAATGSLGAAGVVLASGLELGTVDSDGGLRAALRDFGAGIELLRSTPVLVQLLGFGVAYNLFVAPFGSVLLPGTARTAFGDAAALTALLVGWQGGTLVGNAVAGRASLPAGTKLAGGVAVVGGGTLLAGAVLTTGLPAALAAGGLPIAPLAVALPLFLAGLGQPLFNVTGSSLLQATAPEDTRGTVVTVQNSLLQASFPVPLLVAGRLLTVLSPGTLLAGAGIGLLGLAAVVALTFDGHAGQL